MEKRLTEVYSEVDEMKHGLYCPQPGNRAACSFCIWRGTKYITSVTSNDANIADEEGIVTRLTWGEQMELEDKTEDRDGSLDCPRGNKVCLTQVQYISPQKSFFVRRSPRSAMLIEGNSSNVLSCQTRLSLPPHS